MPSTLEPGEKVEPLQAMNRKLAKGVGTGTGPVVIICDARGDDSERSSFSSISSSGMEAAFCSMDQSLRLDQFQNEVEFTTPPMTSLVLLETTGQQQRVHWAANAIKVLRQQNPIQMSTMEMNTIGQSTLSSRVARIIRDTAETSRFSFQADMDLSSASSPLTS